MALACGLDRVEVEVVVDIDEMADDIEKAGSMFSLPSSEVSDIVENNEMTSLPKLSELVYTC